MGFSTSLQLQKSKIIEGGPFEGDIKFFRQSFTKPKRERKKFQCQKNFERGTLLLWNGFVFHVKGFGFVQNEVLSGTYMVRSVV